jgi:hypothetical protein
MSSLRLISLAELKAKEDARLRALDTPTATVALLRAMERLADQEARRIGVPMLDRTYHGCDPSWRDALNAAADLAYVVLGEQARTWGVPRLELGEERS